MPRLREEWSDPFHHRRRRFVDVIDDSLDSGPSLASALTLTPWGNGKWLDPCRADFVFAPYFDTKNMQNDWVGLNNWEKNDCGAEGCEGFQRAVSLGSIIGLVGVGVHSIVDFGLHVTINALVFVVLVAFLSIRSLRPQVSRRRAA